MTKLVRIACGILVLAPVGLLQGQARQASLQPQQSDVFRGRPGPLPDGAPGQPRTVTIPYKRGEDIAGRIAATTDSVTVAYGSDRPLEAPRPEGMSEFEFLSRELDAVGLVRVVKTSGEFTPKRDWVFTRVEAHVVEVLKSTPRERQLADGMQSFTFRTSGGTARIGNTTVVAVAPFEQVRPGQTYLAFLFVDDDGLLRAAPNHLFELANRQFRRMQRHPEEPEFVEDDVEFHLAKIRAAKALPRVWPKGGAR